MASLSNLYIKLDTLEKIVSILKKRKESGIRLTVSLNDEQNQFGNNVSAWIEQTKEARKAGQDRYYVGNGMTFWSDGTASAFKFSKDYNNNPPF